MSPRQTSMNRSNFLRWIKSWDTLAIAFLAAFPFLYYLPVTLGLQVFVEGDLQVVSLPTFTELARALADGRLPLWTPGIEAGFPLFASGQTGALYPPIALLFWLPPLTALSYTSLFHKAWIAIGMYLFCRAFGLRSPSAFLAGIALSFGGFVTARLPHITLLATASWLPWLLLFQIKYWRAKWLNQRTVIWFLLICLGLAIQFLSSSPPIAFFNVATFALLGTLAHWVWGNQRVTLNKTSIVENFRRLMQSILFTILQIGLGIGLAAIQLLPTAELINFSNRAQAGFDFFTTYSMEPQYLTQFVAPFTTFSQPEQSNMEYWAYIGVLPFFLALLAPVLRRDARTWFFFACGLIATVLALGKFTPLYSFLYAVPIFNQFRVPARLLFLFSLIGAFLAGIGFEELRRRLKDDGRRIGWAQLVIAAAFGLVISLIVYLAHTQPIDFWMSVWAWLPALLILLRVENLVLSGGRKIAPVLFVIVVLGITLIDLSSFSAPFLTTLAQTKSPSELAAVPRTIGAMDNRQSIYRVYAAKYPPVTLSSYRAALLDNTALVYGKQAVMAYQPLDLQRNQEYIHQMSPAMRDLMNIRYYLAPTEALPEAYPLTDQSEPAMGLSLEILRNQPRIPPTRATRVELVSYTDQSGDLPNDFVAGELVLTKDTGEEITFPIRMGKETADWTFDAMPPGKIKHSRPANAIGFPAYLGSVGHEFQGNAYITRYDLAQGPLTITAVGVRPFLLGVQLNIESINLIDEQGNSASLASLIGQNDTVLVFKSQTATMWENHDVLPRAFVVHQAEILDDQTELARLQDRNFRPDQVVFLSDTSPADLIKTASPQNANDQAIISSYRPESVTVNVKTDTAGYLVLTDSWYPGWVASVDGRPTSIFRADYMFRAVALDAGEHTVTFEYHPLSFWWGVIISGISSIVCVGVAFVENSRRTSTSIAR